MPAYWDYQARIDHLPAGGGRLSFFAFGSDDDLEVVSADPNRRIELGTHVALPPGPADLDHHPGRLALAAAAGLRLRRRRLRRRPRPRHHPQPPAVPARGSEPRLRPPARRWRSASTASSATTGPASTSPSPRGPHLRPGHAPSGWWPAAPSSTSPPPSGWRPASRPSPRLRIVPGVRADSLLRGGDPPRTRSTRACCVRWQLAPGLALRAGAGLYHQLPKPRYLDDEFGNPALALTRARQLQLGLDAGPRPRSCRSAPPCSRWRRTAHPGAQRRSASPARARPALARHRAPDPAPADPALLRLDRLHPVPRRAERRASPTRSRAAWPAPAAPPRTRAPAAAGARPPSTRPTTWWRWPATARQSWEVGLRYRLVSGRPDHAHRRLLRRPRLRGLLARAGPPPTPPGSPAFSQLDLRVERTFTCDCCGWGSSSTCRTCSNAENAEDVALRLPLPAERARARLAHLAAAGHAGDVLTCARHLRAGLLAVASAARRPPAARSSTIPARCRTCACWRCPPSRPR